MAVKTELDLVPRVSILEKGQADLQKDLQNLSASVRHQGEQLTAAITSLSANQNTNYNALAEKISSSTKTDWQSFWSMIGVLVLIGGSIMGYVQTQFNYVATENSRLEKAVDRLQDLAEKSIQEGATNSARLNTLENNKHGT